MNTKTPPEHFVNLHLHTSAGSIGDAIGSAADHFAFAHKNGMNASAVTDHGNMVSYSFAHMAAKSMKDKGINFKHIPGIEAYFVPSLEKWSEHKKIADERNRLAKEAEKEAKASKTRKKALETIEDEFNVGDETRESIKEMQEMYGSPEADDPESNTIIENEEESKTKNFRDPVKQRNHIVLLAKNDAGLQALFRLTSRGFTEGFYRYPRLDLKMLKEECKGNVVALSACCAGNLASIVFDNQITADHNLWLPNNDNFELIQKLLKERIEEFKDAVGEENYYAEIQFNKLGFQHLANYHIIEAAKRTNTKLVATADAHYSDPSHWREREIYKAMAWASKNKGQIEKDKIPQTIDGMKCELYPKNAEQMWKGYKEYCADKFDFYDDDIVKQAIHNSWIIANEQIETPTPDRKVKLPSIRKLIPLNYLEEEIEKLGSGANDEDLIAFEDLKRLAKEGLVKRKKDTNKEYVARLVEELRVIKKLKFSRYFLTYAKIMNTTTDVMLTGFGRGSAAGSLLAYCLNITQVDPIKYNLLFERFLTEKKVDSYPDIDCIDSSHLIAMADGTFKPIRDICVRDVILDLDSKPKHVLCVQTRSTTKQDIMLRFFVEDSGTYGTIVATSKHRLFLNDRSIIEASCAVPGQTLHSKTGGAYILAIEPVDDCTTVTDITVEGSRSFQLIPHNTAIIDCNSGKFIVSIDSYSIDADDYRSVVEKECYEDFKGSGRAIKIQ